MGTFSEPLDKSCRVHQDRKIYDKGFACSQNPSEPVSGKEGLGYQTHINFVYGLPYGMGLSSFSYSYHQIPFLLREFFCKPMQYSCTASWCRTGAVRFRRSFWSYRWSPSVSSSSRHTKWSSPPSLTLASSSALA